MEFLEGDLTDPAVCAKACAGSRSPSTRRRWLRCRARWPIQCLPTPIAWTLLLACWWRRMRLGCAVWSMRDVFGLWRHADPAKHENMLPNPISPTPWPSLPASITCASSRVFMKWNRGAALLQRLRTLSGPTSHYSGVLAFFAAGCWPASNPRFWGWRAESRLTTSTMLFMQSAGRSRSGGEGVGPDDECGDWRRVTLNQTFEILCELTGYTGRCLRRESRGTSVTRSPTLGWPGGCSAMSRSRLPRGSARTVEWYGPLFRTRVSERIPGRYSLLEFLCDAVYD